MGSPPAEIEEALQYSWYPEWAEFVHSESPQHKVVLTQPFYVGVYEVTQAEYQKVMQTNPSAFAVGGRHSDVAAGLETAGFPVEMVSWNDATEFCARLSQLEELAPNYSRELEVITFLEGTGYRLPTEAQWEFSCRAGTTTQFWIGDQDEDLIPAAWFAMNSAGRTHPVGQLMANPFALYDVHGNVWEWVEDASFPTTYANFGGQPAIDPFTAGFPRVHRVIRGGNWCDHASLCRAGSRPVTDSSAHLNYTGFRVSLPVDSVRRAVNSFPPLALQCFVGPFCRKGLSP